MTNEDVIIKTIAAELNLAAHQVAATVALLGDGNTVPFIARYRKEATVSLDEAQVRTIESRLAYLRNLKARKATVLKSIAEQGKLTPGLEAAIRSAMVLQEVEDLYLPYKPKRRTRATVARERGLEPLAELILAQELIHGSLEEHAAPFLSDDVLTVEEAYAGARDIVAEVVAEDAEVRKTTRHETHQRALLVTSLADESADPRGVYRLYYDYREPLREVPPHRLLAINRGEREGVLRVRLETPADDLIADTEASYLNPRSLFADQVRASVADGYARLLAPAIERDLHSTSTAEADDHAIQVFSTNLRHLLLQPPLQGRRVMGIDPGFRTGCKVACMDATGKVLDTATIYPHEPQKRWQKAKKLLSALIIKNTIDVIAVGNGTASRETEHLAAEVIAEFPASLLETETTEKGTALQYTIVSEAGASVYSASELARAELPALDVSMRGAVSIARRLQDPLAELVKIEPKSIGVGLYQHDVDQKKLSTALDAVVESVVNYVGVDLNTASPALLQYVSGINKRVAANVVAHRDAHGPFRTREELQAVKGLGARAFEQAAGFLKIPDGDNPLDNTFIHPESYPVVERLFALMGVHGDEPDLAARVQSFRSGEKIEELVEVLGVGAPTLTDIFESLVKPGRDPRDELPPPVLRQDVLHIEDLHEGMILTGTVRNVVDFGAFVDIGVKRDGLVHISEMSDHYVRNPLEVVAVGDVVQVRVISVDAERGRIGLSMRK
jgi:uncharacterized protein